LTARFHFTRNYPRVPRTVCCSRRDAFTAHRAAERPTAPFPLPRRTPVRRYYSGRGAMDLFAERRRAAAEHRLFLRCFFSCYIYYGFAPCLVGRAWVRPAAFTERPCSLVLCSWLLPLLVCGVSALCVPFFTCNLVVLGVLLFVTGRRCCHWHNIRPCLLVPILWTLVC